MSLVSSTVPNLVNGVSQQPDSLRLTSQCQLQDNGYSTVVKGVRKRAPFRHLAKLSSSTTFNSAFLHTINRDAVERYTVVITNGNLQVFDMTGAAMTMSFPNGTAYLNNANPQQGFAAVTVADYTFIANKAVTCAMTGAISTVRNKEALLYFFQQLPNGTLSSVNCQIIVGGTAYTFNATGAASAKSTNQMAGDALAFFAASGANTLLSFTWMGSVMYVQARSPGTDFTITTADSSGNNAVLCFKDTVQDFSTLPKSAVDGFQIKVTGSSNTQFDAYYVKYSDPNAVPLNGTSNSGVWLETMQQGINNTIDATTLPWQLVRTSAGHFTFDKATWTDRTVGDAVTAPNPSFIGKQINDVYFHRNRLGFLAGENSIMSKAGKFFTFWPFTITAVLDSDPIDVAAIHTKPATMRAAVPYATDLMLFSDLTQFVLAGTDLLTPKTVSIKPSTEFENSSSMAKPVATGRNVYFALARGTYTGLREYTTTAISGIRDAPEVTSHVPAYLPANITKIAYTSNESVIACISATTPNVIYIYKTFFDPTPSSMYQIAQKLQSSWSTWTLAPGDIILNVDFIQTDMFAVIQRSDGLYLEVASLEIGRQDAGFNFQVHLDRRLDSLTGSYNGGTNTTTWTLPYSEANPMVVVLGSAWGAQTGLTPTITRPSNTTIAAIGNFSAHSCYVGRTYTFRYRFSHQLMREASKNGGQQAVTEGRLQLTRFSVTFEQSGYFRAEVTPFAGNSPGSYNTNAYAFTGYITGSVQSALGTSPIIDGVFRFPVFTNAATVQIDLVNDTFLPSGFQQAGWEGNYYIRSGRV